MQTLHANEHHLLFVKAAMAYRGVTMTELSRSIDVPYRTIQDYLRGKSRMPPRVVGLVAQRLDVTADFLLYGSPRLDATVVAQCLKTMDHIRESGGSIDRPEALFMRLYQENFRPRVDDSRSYVDLMQSDIRERRATGFASDGEED